MNIAHKAVLVTGAGRGIGRALVEEALRKDAGRVYAAARRPVAYPDPRVTPLLLDVTDAAQIQRAVESIETLDVLVNNAGVFQLDDLSERSAIEQHLAVNLFGTYSMSRAFLPALMRSRGAIVNVLSIAGLAPVPMSPAYSISKAAALSFSQSQRALLAGSGVNVHIVLPGLVDTDMVRGLDLPKASPESVAQAIFHGVENGEEEIFPDALSATLTDGWRAGVIKALERQNAGYLLPTPV